MEGGQGLNSLDLSLDMTLVQVPQLPCSLLELYAKRG